MKLLFFGCLHAADRAPAGRVDDYRATVLTKLWAISDLCRQYKVEYCVSLGDIFHNKRPNRVSHALVQDLISVFHRFPCPVGVVVGNHDMGPDELESLGRQPLGVLAHAGVIELLTEMRLFGKEGDIATQVWVVPRPYNYAGDADPAYYSLTKEERQLVQERPGYVIGVAHGSVVEPGNSRPFPHVPIDQVPDVEEYDLFVAGHLHENLGITLVERDTIFANPGSVMRTARTLANYTRKVQVLIVTLGTNVKVHQADALTLVDIPGVVPAFEVFGGKEAKDAPDLPEDEISRFVEVLGEGLRADELTIPELLAELGDIELEVKVEVQRLLEEAS